ncbi:hypothetical protein DX914_17550 [Lysobacter silvisoli]|uniref:Uncharacterized protein n=1 Tax=Lysobacter silvisoli TaxID=2293254 RepID=A0A371JYS0_9GAMM|nr:hypothetical protein DX914_17550 [Lysobacter silvisoli]
MLLILARAPNSQPELQTRRAAHRRCAVFRWHRMCHLKIPAYAPLSQGSSGVAFFFGYFLLTLIKRK